MAVANIMVNKKKINRIILIFKNCRFISLFIFIGISSLVFELGVYNLLKKFFAEGYSSILSLLSSIIFAFYFNFFFNFKVHISKIKKALLFFIFISMTSWILQNIIIYFIKVDYSYETKRLLTSAIIFLFFYLLHKKYSFRDYKKVGIAVYLSNLLDINNIFKKVKNYPDFVHVDIVDKNFSSKKILNNITLLSKIKNLWPNLEIHAHIMSATPSKWIDKIIDYCDLIYVHFEIRENLKEIYEKIVLNNKKFGIALKLKTPPNKIIPILNKSYGLLLLSVDKPGFSNQNFNSKALKLIEYFNNLNFRSKFRLCIDGGISSNISKGLDVDDVVSNSSILKSVSPKREILFMRYN